MSVFKILLDNTNTFLLQLQLNIAYIGCQLPVCVYFVSKSLVFVIVYFQQDLPLISNKVRRRKNVKTADIIMLINKQGYVPSKVISVGSPKDCLQKFWTLRTCLCGVFSSAFFAVFLVSLDKCYSSFLYSLSSYSLITFYNMYNAPCFNWHRIAKSVNLNMSGIQVESTWNTFEIIFK